MRIRHHIRKYWWFFEFYKKRTASNIWNYIKAKVKSYLGIGDNDIIPVSHGGTGQSTLSALRNALGLGNTTSALPVANGGTGATSKAGALANLGIPSNVADSMVKSVYDSRIDDAPINYAVYVNEHTDGVNVECNSQTGIYNVTSKELKGGSDDLMVASGIPEGQYKAIVQVAHSNGNGWTHRNIGSGIFYWMVTTDTDNRSWSEIKAANMIASHDITTNPSFDVPKDGIAYIVYKNDNNGSISFEKNDKIRMMIVKGTANADGVDLFDDNIYNYRARNITLQEDMRQALQDMKASFQGGVDKIVQAIKGNGVTPSASTPTACEAAINSIRSGGNATAAQILKGQTAIVNKATVTGTMANNGAVSKAINAGGSYTIPAGYHNGSGKVTANNATWTETDNTMHYINFYSSDAYVYLYNAVSITAQIKGFDSTYYCKIIKQKEGESTTSNLFKDNIQIGNGTKTITISESEINSLLAGGYRRLVFYIYPNSSGANAQPGYQFTVKRREKKY